MDSPLHIWITGGSKGIGGSVAELVASEHNVTISSLSGGLPEALATHPNVNVVRCDVGSQGSVRDAYDLAIERFGPVQVLVNSAGTAHFKPLVEMSVEEFDAQVATNLRGVFLCIKAVLPTMISANSGMICTINSVSTQKAFTGCTGYGASKSGALALTRSLREEVRTSGVKVVDFIVGATATDIWSAEALATHSSQMMKSSDIANSVMNVIGQYHHPRMVVEEVILRPLLGDL